MNLLTKFLSNVCEGPANLKDFNNLFYHPLVRPDWSNKPKVSNDQLMGNILLKCFYWGMAGGQNRSVSCISGISETL